MEYEDNTIISYNELCKLDLDEMVVLAINDRWPPADLEEARIVYAEMEANMGTSFGE